MFIFGHVGFTTAAYALNKRRQPFCFKKVLLIGTLALMPDVFDRVLQLIIKTYPVPGLFHSLLFYASALTLSFFFFRHFFYYLIIMAGHVVLDIVNTNLGSLMYPLFGLANNMGGAAMESPFIFLNHWPKTVGYRLQTGHYLIFEAMGILLICFVVWRLIGTRKMKESLLTQSRKDANQRLSV